VFDLLLGIIKDRLPDVFGKRSKVTLLDYIPAGKVLTQSECISPAGAGIAAKRRKGA